MNPDFDYKSMKKLTYNKISGQKFYVVILIK